jgi:hypothetical protein
MWSGPNLRYYPGHLPGGLRKTLSQGSQSVHQDLNPTPPKYKAGVLTTLPQRLAIMTRIFHGFLQYIHANATIVI